MPTTNSRETFARRARRWWPGLALAAMLVALFPPVFLHGWVISANDILYQHPPFDELAPPGFQRAHNPLLTDQPYFFYPERAFLRSQVRQGIWPWWMPSILGGHSFVLVVSAQAFHPMQLLVWLLPQTVGETLYVLLKLLAGGLGMVCFLRRRGVMTPAALAAGLAFMVCSYNVVWLNHPHSSVSTMLPWCLWLVEAAFQRRPRTPATLLAGGAIFYLVIAGGHPNTTINALFLAGLYAVYRLLVALRAEDRRRCARAIGAVGVSLGLGILLTGVFMVPFGLARISGDYHYGGRQGVAQLARPLPAREYRPLILPRADGSPVTGDDRHLYNFNENAMFVGVVVLVAQLLALPWLLRRWDSWFLLGVCLMVFLALQDLTPVSYVVRHLPVLRDNSLQRMSLLIQFGLAAGGGIAWHVLATRPADRRHRLILGAVAALVVVAGLVATSSLRSAPGYGWFAMALVGAAMAGTLLPWMSRPAARAWVLAGVCLLVAAEVWAAHADFNGTLPRQVAEVPVPKLAQQLREEVEGRWHRITAVDYAILPPQSAGWLGLNDLRGAEIPLSIRYTGLMPWHEAFRIGAGWSIDRLADPTWRRMLEVMGVRHVLVKDGTGVHTVDLPGALPHVFWADKLTRGTGSIARDLEVVQRGAMVAQLPPGMEPGDGAGSLTTRSTDVNRVVLEAEVTRPGLLVLNEMPIPGWRAQVDGRTATVMPVNVVQVGVWLEAGRHTVELWFRPRGARLGALLSAGGLVAMAALAVLAWRS